MLQPRKPDIATELNARFRQPVPKSGHLHAAALAVRASRASNQAVVTATNTPVQFTAVDYDPREMWDSGSDTRLTVVERGVYSFVAHGTLVAGSALGQGWIRKNGSETLAAISPVSGTGLFFWELNVAAQDYMDVGDYVEFLVHQTTGSNKNLNPASFAAAKLATV